jgi:hypothetical protein
MARRSGSQQHTGTLFTVGTGDTLDITPGATFTDRDLIKIDQAIRHLPIVIRTLEQKAREVIQATGSPDDWEIVVSTKGKQRPRVYVVPKPGGKGIRAELTDSVLTKASLAMVGH